MRREVIKILLFASVLLNASILVLNFSTDLSWASSTLPTDRPSVFVDPSQVTASVGQEFTVSVKVFNLTNNYVTDPVVPSVSVPLGNLFGFDLNFTWDPLKLQYISHTPTIPVEDYPEGVLHNHPDLGVAEIANNVNAGVGTYNIAYACYAGADIFNNPGTNSTIFRMTFRVREKGAAMLRLVSTDLSAQPAPNRSPRILHAKFDGYFETPGTPRASFSYWPPDGKAVKNKAVAFDASASYDPDGSIVSYGWNFGDGATGTGEITTHPYANLGSFTVTLVVVDNDGTSSAPATKAVSVVEARDIEVRDLSVSKAIILQNRTLGIDVYVRNLGKVDENSTVTASFNQTAVDPENLEATQWMEIGKKSVVGVSPGSETLFEFNWTTTVPAATYYILANASLVPHETNVTNNIRLSSGVIVTTEIRHDIAVTKIEVAVIEATQEFDPPVIVGENVSLRVSVKAMQSADETFDLTLRLVAQNNTVLDSRDWLDQFLEAGTIKELEFATTKWAAGNCVVNATAMIPESDLNQTNNSMAKTAKATRPPVLAVAPLPGTIHVDDAVSLDATGSTFPDGTLTYKWKLWEPSLNPDSANPSSTQAGSVVSFVFTNSGNWTVRLEVTDENSITYNEFRRATYSYRKEFKVKVDEKPGLLAGVPNEVLYAAVGVIAVAVVGGLFYFTRLRKPKTQEAQETQEL